MTIRLIDFFIKENSPLNCESGRHFGWSGGQKGGVGPPPSKSVAELIATNNSTARPIRLIDFFINGHSLLKSECGGQDSLIPLIEGKDMPPGV